MSNKYAMIFFLTLFVSCTAMNDSRHHEFFSSFFTQAQIVAWRLRCHFMYNVPVSLKVIRSDSSQVHLLIPNEFLPYAPEDCVLSFQKKQ